MLAGHWKRYAVNVVRSMKAARERDGHDDDVYGWQGHQLYCEHGTYVGDPGGPDYMCGVCESGESIYEYALSRAYSHQGAATDKFRENVALAIIKAIPSENGRSLIAEDEIKRVADLLCALSKGTTMPVTA